MTKKTLKLKVPDFVMCSKCGGRLDPRVYIAWPGENTPKERVTLIFEPNHPRFSVSCPNCAQYTVFSPLERDNPLRKT